METVAPFSLVIPRTKEIFDGKKAVTYYIIEIYKKGYDKWNLEKRFREFDDLDKALKKLYGNLPVIPGKTLLTLKESAEIERRRGQLEKYLQELIMRTDVLSSDVFKRFLQIDNIAPEAIVAPPVLLGEISNFVLGVRDFEYQPETGLLFVGISDMSATSRVDSHLTNMKMPWEKEVPKNTLITVGAVECYIQTSGIEDGPKFEKLWTKTFQTQVIHLHWDAASCTLLIGKDDGVLTVFKIPSDLKYMHYDELYATKLHEARIMGIYFDSLRQFVYSVGEDKKFKVLNLDKNYISADLACGDTKLTTLVGDTENKRAFVTNRSGQLFIYSTDSVIPTLVQIIQSHHKGSVRGLYYDSYKNYLVSANYDDGILSVIDLQKPGKEKFAHSVANLHGKPRVRCVVWSTGRTEVFTADEDGNLGFWDVKKAAPIYAMRAHLSGVTKLQWLEKSNVLITGGKDKKIKFYKIPEVWRDLKIEAELLKEAKIRKQTEMMVEFKRRQQKMDEDSDEDDLAGWARDT